MDRLIKYDAAVEAVRDALENLDLVSGPDLSDADVVGEAIKKYGHSLSDMGLDIADVADEDWVPENIDLDRVMGNHSCGDLTEKLCEYHGTSDVLVEIEASMRRTDWAAFIVGEAINTLGYTDQSILLGKMLEQNDGGRTEAALKDLGWAKEEEVAATPEGLKKILDASSSDHEGPIDLFVNAYGTEAILDHIDDATLLDYVKRHDSERADPALAWEVDRWIQSKGAHEVLSTVLLHPEASVERIVAATGDLAVKWRHDIAAGMLAQLGAPAWKHKDSESQKAYLAVDTIEGPSLINALMECHGHTNTVQTIKAWGAENGVDPFKSIRSEVEAEVKKQMAERIMACLFGGGL